MRLSKLGVIGNGAIATMVLEILASKIDKPFDQLSILTRPGRVEAVKEQYRQHIGVLANDLIVLDELEAFAALAPEFVAEAAGHSAVAEYVPHLLANGIETAIASIGALSEQTLYNRLEEAAVAGGTRLVLPAGAVGGIDVLSALKQAGLRKVDYASRKPPSAWKGTKAEAITALDAIDSETELFNGSARQAASMYPKNANVAATVALAGVGLDKTRVALIADPSVKTNVHTFEAESDAARVSVRIEGVPSPSNPKTSLPTVYSLVREVMRRVSPIVS